MLALPNAVSAATCPTKTLSDCSVKNVNCETTQTCITQSNCSTSNVLSASKTCDIASLLNNSKVKELIKNGSCKASDIVTGIQSGSCKTAAGTNDYLNNLLKNINRKGAIV